ncbi:MAG: cbb3-type cytochrome c oxidase subunit 3 [Variibacter sp.]
MIAHDTMLWLSKSFGLFYLLGLSAIVLLYVYWPSNKKQFDRAASAILEDEDRPWR